MLNKSIKFLIENKLIALILLILFVGWGIVNAPFDWDTGVFPRNPVAVDAIPDIGENQQIVFTRWDGRSPRDIEDQISYPLTTALLGIPGVKTIRSSSMFGFSSIYIIFDESIAFYWSRSRVLEKLNSLPKNLLPEGVQPVLGPDATGLGQIFWYTLEGRDQQGKVIGGWDLHELRSIQDYYVKYALASSKGVSEVASIGGYVMEYQIDVNPNALKEYGITLQKVVDAVRKSNRDIGAQTIEINKAEYLVRGLGYVKHIADIENAVVSVVKHTPIRIKDIAMVSRGPAARRGILDKEGAEVVGGVVVARYGANPMEVIQGVKHKIAEIAPGLPSKTLSDGRKSQLTIVPFYDRTQLIKETLHTLNEALSLEILITILVIIVMVMNLRTSVLVSGLLPVAVLMVFTGMKFLNVDANIVALSGIAIAIGTMVDMGIILSENIIRHLENAKAVASRTRKKIAVNQIVYTATSEVSGAIITAVLTTIVSFIPVFTMQAAEGKLFRPLAFTKTMALVASIIVSLWLIPPFAAWMFGSRQARKKIRLAGLSILLIIGLTGLIKGFFIAIIPVVFAITGGLKSYEKITEKHQNSINILASALAICILLTRQWRPFGIDKTLVTNFIFVLVVTFGLLLLFKLFRSYYGRILTWTLDNKLKFLSLPFIILLFGITIWIGFPFVFGFIPKSVDAIGVNIRDTRTWNHLVQLFPGIGKEFMPALNEGSFLLMPTSMPHSGIGENKRVLRQLDMAVAAIPEIATVVGKAGRVESALDPAPLSMYENIIIYKPEYIVDENGNRLRFKTDKENRFLRKNKLPPVENPNNTDMENIDAKKRDVMFDIFKNVTKEELIGDENGSFYRQWRKKIKSPDDIWNEIVKVTKLPGVTSAPKLQPIETRLVMLQTGMRAPMGIKIKGQNLQQIENFGLKLEKIIRKVPGVKKESVFADRIVGKPYMLIDIDREKAARYGLNVDDVQRILEVAIGGKTLSYTVEGRERYPIRVRYPRELRDSPNVLQKIYVPTPDGTPIPLGQLVHIKYEQGPQVIKSEDTFLVGYLLFDKEKGYAEVNVVEHAQNVLKANIADGSLVVPKGLSYTFTGTYENQVRAEKRLMLIVPLALLIIFMILYFQFRSLTTSFIVFSGISVAFAGGFMMLWFYGQDWFLNFDVFGNNMRTVFQMHPINLSIAVWVGFIALFGIATDDGVVMTTYMLQTLKRNKPKTKEAVKKAVLEAGQKRIRPCLMTSATTLLALLPILTSSGKGSDIMIPMAIPSFGGMLVVLITLFVVPVLYCWKEEIKLKKNAIEKQ